MDCEFNIIVGPDEHGWYVAFVPALLSCHTQTRSLNGLLKRVREAIELRLEVGAETDEGLEFVGVQPVRVPA